MSDTAHPTRSEVDASAYGAWLFDMDGVLTKTAAVHAAAWKQAFDEFLRAHASRDGSAFTPFDIEHDYERYVDGEPRDDGVRNFLASRGVTLPEGDDGDGPETRSVKGLGNRKNELVLEVMRRDGVAAFEGAAALVKELRGREHQGRPRGGRDRRPLRRDRRRQRRQTAGPQRKACARQLPRRRSTARRRRTALRRARRRTRGRRSRSGREVRPGHRRRPPRRRR